MFVAVLCSKKGQHRGIWLDSQLPLELKVNVLPCFPAPRLFFCSQADTARRMRQGNMTKKGKKLAQKVNLGSKCKQRKEGVGWGGGRKMEEETWWGRQSEQKR